MIINIHQKRKHKDNNCLFKSQNGKLISFIYFFFSFLFWISSYY